MERERRGEEGEEEGFETGEGDKESSRVEEGKFGKVEGDEHEREGKGEKQEGEARRRGGGRVGGEMVEKRAEKRGEEEKGEETKKVVEKGVEKVWRVQYMIHVYLVLVSHAGTA